MKPSVLATADRLPANWAQPRILRFSAPAVSREEAPRSSVWVSAAAWLLIVMVPLLVGGVVVTALDEPLLGVIAATLAMIPLLIGLCPRQRG
jgi:hypothetical protein